MATLLLYPIGGVTPGRRAAVPTASPAAAHAYQPPPIRHVFVIMLENEGYAGTFGDPAADPYLARTLPAQGALLTEYYATGHVSNDNYISFVSGQAPNAENQGDCQAYANFTPAGLGEHDGQQLGEGCVYPSAVASLATQLSARGLTWKGYMQDMGNDPSRESTVCAHPAINTRDKTQEAVPGDGYVARHDPFVYFHGIIDNPRYCDAHVVPLGTLSGALPRGAPAGTTGLATDLRSVATTPNFSWITPNVCNDGHDYPCTNQRSLRSALDDIDAFLRSWVPLITSSPAFRENGLLEITFDESAGPQSDSSDCCGETPGPGSPMPGITGPGGGRVGAVLISPFIRPGTVTARPYNHYSSLASIEQLFALPRLGEAATVTTRFGPDVYTGAPRAAGAAPRPPAAFDGALAVPTTGRTTPVPPAPGRGALAFTGDTPALATAGSGALALGAVGLLLGTRRRRARR